MATDTGSTRTGDALPGEIQYKPVCPAAVLSLLFGMAAAVAAPSVADTGPWAFTPIPVVGLLLGLRAFGKIRRYDMTGEKVARAGLALSAVALAGGLGGYAYVTATEVPPGYRLISYEPLQPKGAEMLARGAQALDGKKVYIKGYVYPTSQSRGITSFVLCRDNGTCCFGGQPKLTDMVEVKLKDPLTLDYSAGLHGVGGTLRVRPESSPGGLGTVLYHIDDADVLR